MCPMLVSVVDYLVRTGQQDVDYEEHQLSQSLHVLLDHWTKVLGMLVACRKNSIVSVILSALVLVI